MIKLLRVMISFDAKKSTDISRQTYHIKEEDFMSGKEMIIIPGGKKVKNIKIKLIEVEE